MNNFQDVNGFSDVEHSPSSKNGFHDSIVSNEMNILQAYRTPVI